MRIKLRFAELTQPLFLNGRNFTTKLDTKKGLVMEYDRVEKELLVTYNGETSIVPSSAVTNMIVDKPQPPAPEYQSHPQTATIGAAQVSTPFGHVFAGPGAGKSGVGGKD